MVDQLAALVDAAAQSVEIAHAIRLGFGGVDDEVWIPQIAAQGWIIVTGDEGRSKSRGGRLPLVCAQYGVTYAAFSPSLGKCPSFQKVRVLVDLWEELIALNDVPRGTGFQIRNAGTQHLLRPHLVLKRPATFVLPPEFGENPAP